jgi:hypothetical protein
MRRLIVLFSNEDDESDYNMLSDLIDGVADEHLFELFDDVKQLFDTE